MTGYADLERRYRLDERIATGGMGRVWRATDTLLDRRVAVKVLREEYADDPVFRRRFAQEGRNAGGLHHPGIATVLDAGEEPTPFLVMEYVDGRPLSELLRPEAPLDPDVARDLLGQVAEALAVAHEAGIIHRDVKPGNLLVTPDGQVKVTDFGIARALEGAALTETGQVIGTPQYLSPEQARGDRATEASDVYSLGVVAFEALAGHRPFTGETPVTTALAHLRDPVPELPEHVPADLSAVVRRALAKDPAARYHSAAELATALRDPASAAATAMMASSPVPGATRAVPPATAVLPSAGDGGGGADPHDPRRERRMPAWLPWLLGLLTLLLLVAVAVAVLSGDEGTPATPGAPTSSPTAQPTAQPSAATTGPTTGPTGPTDPTTGPTQTQRAATPTEAATPDNPGKGTTPGDKAKGPKKPKKPKKDNT